MSLATVQAQIRLFMQKAEQQTPATPGIPDAAVRGLRVKLISEELEEFIAAQVQQDIVGVADAIADLVYVVVGAAVAWGIELAPIFEEVHASNMTKFIDGYRRADNKWMKGPSYRPANLLSIIERQIPCTHTVYSMADLEGGIRCKCCQRCGHHWDLEMEHDKV